MRLAKTITILAALFAFSAISAGPVSAAKPPPKFWVTFSWTGTTCASNLIVTYHWSVTPHNADWVVAFAGNPASVAEAKTQTFTSPSGSFSVTTTDPVTSDAYNGGGYFATDAQNAQDIGMHRTFAATSGGTC